jgi:coenzyme F420-reducing hydrogenase gamma subunit
MLVTNKDKQSSGNDSKRGAARRLRHLPVESPLRSNPNRHDQSVCPVCGEVIEKTASGGRRKHSCSKRGATLNKQLTCRSCGTNRVWQGKQGVACRGCGTEYKSAAGSLLQNRSYTH